MTNTLDLLLVISLSVLALSFLVFLFFFVPILIEANRALRSVNNLLDTMKSYAEGTSSEISKAFHTVSNSLKIVGGHILDLATGFKDTLVETFSKNRL